MNATTRLILLTILCLQNRISEAASTDIGEQWVYSYQASTIVGNNLSSDAASLWSLSAKLIIQDYKDHKIFKLEDVKTTAYNGLVSATPTLPEMKIPQDTSILTEPFVVHYNRNFEKLERVNFLPNEPQWSINIKKAIASVYQLDFPNVPKNGDVNDNKNEELNIYGKCKVNYKNLSSKSAITILKELQTKDCIIENSSRQTWANVDLGHFNGDISRSYIYDKLVTDTTSPVKSIESIAQFQYWMLKSDRSIHQIKQTQQFNFVSSSPITKKSDTTPYTLKKSPAYEFENTSRQTSPKTKQENLENVALQFLYLKRQINDNKSSDLNEERFNAVENLLSSLSVMDLETLKLDAFKEDSQVFNLLSSVLPYVGTEASVEFIKEIVQNNTQIDLNELRLLGLFPLYVNNPSEELVNKMEKLLDTELKGVSETVKQTYILSFSNLVYQMYYGKLDGTNNPTTAKEFYKNFAKKYVQKYYDQFTASNDYSIKMKYVLGMTNMGEVASTQLMSIVQNTSECRHIRALAIYSIKPEMLYKKREAYQLFWPIVKNETEPFQIRAAALSLLLSSNINSSELYSVLSYMNQTSYDASRQHLHNYFYTATLSGKTDCEYCTMKKLAQTMLQGLQTPETNQGLMTSYHQVSYSDDEANFETSLNVHVVANPVTNFVNVFQVTLNHFTGHHKTGEYSVYVKAEGISSKLYKEEYERYFAVKELYKILQEMKLGILDDLDEGLHIEMIVYYDKKAIFALFINKDNIEEMADYIDKIILYIGNNDIITKRDVRNLHFVSDLGTPIYATLKYEHVLGTEFKNYDKIFLDNDHNRDDDENYVLTRVRSMWMSKMNFQSYNPITNTNHGVSKIFSNQNLVKFKLDYNVYELSIKMNDDTSYFDTLFDHKYAVFVDSDILETYCPDCNSVLFLTAQNKTTEKGLNLWLWIKDIQIKEINCSNPRFEKAPLHEIIKKSRVSYRGIPFAQPFVLLAYICDYLYYIPLHDICTTSISTDRIIKEPNQSTLKITFINDALDENYKLNLNFNITLALIQKGIKSSKVLNQWNLNIQRQELEKSVSYDLHYDDTGHNVKLDVHSDLDYVATSPDSDMFSLRPAEPITSRSSVSLQEKDMTPATVEITSLFSVSNEQIEMVNKSKSFELCQTDYQKHYLKDLLLTHAPPTKSCYNASLGLSTYDNYAIYIEFRNISENLRKTLDDEVLQPLKNIGQVDKTVITDSSFNASVVYAALPSTFNLDVGTTHVVANYSVPELLRPRALLKPTSRLIEELRYNSFGLDNLCIIIPRYVITFTGKLVEHDTDTSIIPLIECTNTTRVGLTTNRFTYKLWSDENTFQMGKKEGGFYVMRNGKYLKKNIRAEDYSVDFVNENTFHIVTSRIELYYNGDYLTVRIKSAFIDRMCGMCVSGEITTPNMMSKYFN